MNNNANSFSNITTPLYASLMVISLLISAWLYFSPISSAVIASGTITTQRPTQAITSYQTGKVHTLLVEDYQYVNKGDTLIVLQDDRLNLEKTNIQKNHIKQLVKYTHLKKLLNIALTQKELTSFNKIDPTTVQFEYNQYFALFLKDKNKEDEDQRNKRDNNQLIQNSTIQILSNKLKLLTQELSIVEKEITSNATLFKQNLISNASVSDLEREAISIKKQITNALSEINNAKLSLTNIDNNYADYINNQNTSLLLTLENTYNTLNDLTYQQKNIDIQLKNMQLVSPINGFVVNTSKTGVGSYISAQQPLFEIIPDSQLVARVFVDNNDIEDIKVGQQVEVTISAYNTRTTAPITASITKIATTSMQMDDTFTAYPVEVSFQQTPSNINLKTGMPVQVTILKEKRTVIDYLFSTIKRSVGKSMRE